MCRMSAPWSLCNSCRSCCRKNKTKETPHLYCGCPANTRRLKMLSDRNYSSTDVDKQTLICKAEDALDYEFRNISNKEEWDIENPVMILVTGVGKAWALHKAIEEGINHMWTVSAFQQHPRTILLCDDDATIELRVKTVNYFKKLNEIHNKLIEEDSPGDFQPWYKKMYT